MTQRITLTIKPEKRKLLERLAKNRHTTMSGILDELLEKESAAVKKVTPPVLLGTMLASLEMKDEYKETGSAKAALALLREKKAARR
jgi:hypothetical protein